MVVVSGSGSGSTVGSGSAIGVDSILFFCVILWVGFAWEVGTGAEGGGLVVVSSSVSSTSVDKVGLG